MEIIHKLGRRALKKEGEGSFLLTDKKGSYLSFGSKQNITHMQGWFFLDNHWNMYKCVENIYLDKEMSGLENNFSHVVRMYDSSEEMFYLTSTALIYEAKNYSGNINLELDFRSIFDYDDKNRMYSVQKERDIIIICYEKHKKYLAIKGISEFENVGVWDKREYSYDKLRNTRFEFYIYKAMNIKCKDNIKLFFSFSDKKQEALENVISAAKNEAILKKSCDLRVKNVCKEENISFDAAAHSLDGLRTKIGKGNNELEGLFAGLPWFYQFWSRDELISLKAFMLEGKFEFVKKRLMSYLNSMNNNGRIPNRTPNTLLESADATFWLFKRFFDFLTLLDENGVLKKFFSTNDLELIKHKLHLCIEEQTTKYMKQSLVFSSNKETWMDTDVGNGGREGFCIEIQALFLSTFKLMKLLCRKLKLSFLGYDSLEKMLSEDVRNSFFKDGLLLDRVKDTTPRPNIFIAYYCYPELLKKYEWKMVFDKIIGKLWLDWGGLSTIDKNDTSFQPRYTGHNNLSYHHGDSWFWINNLAAVCMFDLDKKKFHYFIDYIYKASENEILSSGFIGHCAELSSAEKQLSEGCLAQAWSAATFIELAYKFKPL